MNFYSYIIFMLMLSVGFALLWQPTGLTYVLGCSPGTGATGPTGASVYQCGYSDMGTLVSNIGALLANTTQVQNLLGLGTTLLAA